MAEVAAATHVAGAAAACGGARPWLFLLRASSARKSGGRGGGWGGEDVAPVPPGPLPSSETGGRYDVCSVRGVPPDPEFDG